VLGAHQGELSDRFAGRDGKTGADKFDGVDWTRRDFAPLMEDTADVFVGSVERKQPYHDHIMVGVGIERVINRERAPLIYMASDYHRLQVEADRLQSDTD
jgi:flavin reductase (DIM6/NTAB) family NADH-FMN oxidoreductase RutF